MRIAKGNAISYSSDLSGYRAKFGTEDNQRWDLPVVGFAVVVDWTGWDEEAGGPTSFLDEQDLAETSIRPVVIDDGYLSTVEEYIKDREGLRYLGLIIPGES